MEYPPLRPPTDDTIETPVTPEPPPTPPAIPNLADEIRRAVREELADAGYTAVDGIEIAERWEGGKMILQPGREGLQDKEIPIETFFHKIVMARERLRLLEQKINNHPKLVDADRVELQNYISRVYGSFTTFNLLFDNRVDWFIGAKTER